MNLTKRSDAFMCLYTLFLRNEDIPIYNYCQSHLLPYTRCGGRNFKHSAKTL